MRLTEPRIRPLKKSELKGEAAELFERFEGDGSAFNIFRTLLNHPKLLKRWRVFGTHILMKSTLPPREREILILRIGWLCRAGYEFGHHVAEGKEAGLSDEEIIRITEGPDAPGWDSFEATLLRAVDELHGDAFISDVTWGKLSGRYNTQQLMDLIFTVGEYNMVSMALNSLGVQQDEGYGGLPG
jgi:4-carboxymuconolactone decarboxylase